MPSSSDDRNRARRMTENEGMSRSETLFQVLRALEERRDELAAVLPPDIDFPRFHAIINQALRAAPELLGCTFRSIVNACVKAAYDGLRIDGVEAAIVWEMATIKVPGQPDRKEKQARYMPMYRGLVQQVLRGGMVLACEADVIYENDEYEILRGTNPGIQHRPCLTGPRGAPLAVYNVATLPSGYKVSAFMTREEVIDVQKESKSGWDAKGQCSKGVWARWEGEQWKKTVLRRHRKTLPVGRDVVIHDAEAREEFPQFAPAAPHPQLAAGGRAPPRPTREGIEHQRGGLGVPLEFDPQGSGAEEREGEAIEASAARGQFQARANPAAEEAQRRGKPVESSDPGRDEPAAQARAAGIDTAVPADDVEWGVWAVEVEARIAGAETSEAVAQIWREVQPLLDQAEERLSDRINGQLTDRIADLSSDASAGAGAGQAGSSAPAGEPK